MVESGTPRLCVLLGAPRSGTTWLQRLLACSPTVASPQETHLFHLYLQPQLRQWEAHQARLDTAFEQLADTGQAGDRLIGLPTILAREDLIRAQRAMIDAVVARAAQSRANIDWVLEKTPSNSLCVDAVEELCPTARYVHILRDPRDVVRSLRAAGRSWGQWAPTDPAGGAAMWRRHVLGARMARELAPDRYVEVRYEDLRRDPASALAPVLGLLGLDDEAAELVARERAAQGHALNEVFAFRPEVAARVAELPEAEPLGFRRGEGKRPLLSAAQRRIVAVVAGEVAQELGYRTDWPSMGVIDGAVWAGAARAQRSAGRARRWLARRRRKQQDHGSAALIGGSAALDSGKDRLYSWTH